MGCCIFAVYGAVNQEVYTDKGYFSRANDDYSTSHGFKNEGITKKPHGRDYTEEEKVLNRERPKIRVGIEHLNGAIKHAMGRVILGSVGLKRTTCRITGMLMGHNYKRSRYLLCSGKVSIG